MTAFDTTFYYLESRSDKFGKQIPIYGWKL